MRIDQQPAYLLHARPYRETSLLLEIFSRDYGRIGLIARGIRSARRHGQRALLQPGRPLLMSWRDASELPLMAAVEAGAVNPRIEGDGVLSLLYANELLLRLLPRREGLPELFDRYGWLLSLLGDASLRAESLRRFESTLLSACGYGFALETAIDGHAIDPGQRYRYLTGEGLRWVPQAAAAKPGDVSGAALIALHEEAPIDPEWLAPLRHLLRACISERLDGRPLQSWRLSAMLASGSRQSRGADTG